MAQRSPKSSAANTEKRELKQTASLEGKSGSFSLFRTFGTLRFV